MPKKIRWGILSTAKIARKHVIPAIQSSTDCDLVAIASRSLEKAKTVAEQFNIPTYYGSYADMFNDPNIDAIYNPLPNNFHIPLSIEAAKAGKHVLCEKPVAMNKSEAALLRTLPAGIHFMEAFMVRHHLQWKKALQMVQSGELGEVKAIQVYFSFYNNDPKNIRNSPGTGGGAMYDLGCYANVVSKFIFGTKPQKVIALADTDPQFKVDRLTSGIFDFGNGRHLTFSVATQLVLSQRVNIIGSKARLEVLIPFNPVADKPTILLLDRGENLDGSKIETITIPACDHYRSECEVMNKAIRGEETLPYSTEDAIENMHILDAVFRSNTSGVWEFI